MRPFRRPALRHRRFQTWLAIAALATAIALPVVLLSVGGGVAAHELADLQHSGYQVVVSAPGLHGIASAHGLSKRIASLPGITVASPVLSVALDAFPPGGGPTPALAEGVLPSAFLPTLSPGEAKLFPTPIPLGEPTDLVHFANGTYRGPATTDVLVSSPLANVYGLRAGSTLALGATANRSAATGYTVTGVFGVPPTVLGPTAAYALVLPLSDLQVLVSGSNASVPSGTGLDVADTVQVVLAASLASDPAAIDRTASEVQALVPYYGVTSLADQAASLRAGSAVLQGFYFALSSVSLTVGFVFLALVLVRRVETDRRSIGVQRAIGVSAGRIARRIGYEALLLAGAGAVGGVVAGWAVVGALATWGSPLVQSTARLAVFDPTTLVEVTVGVLGLGLLASLSATRYALRLDLPEVLR